jgi:hypothetical protein
MAALRTKPPMLAGNIFAGQRGAGFGIAGFGRVAFIFFAEISYVLRDAGYFQCGTQALRVPLV